MRARAEPFGAWVRVEDGTLVAVDRGAAQRLGVDGGPLWKADPAAHRSRPLEVHVAVTSRCSAGCKGCYLDARPDGEAPSREVLEERLRAIAAAGAFTVAFGGGEPLTRDDLGELAAFARSLGLTPVLTTSGLGLTRERAEALRGFAQINVSYDGTGPAYGLVRGWNGARAAERAMAQLAAAGVPFGVNVVLTRRTFPLLEQTLQRAVALGAREAQLLRYKPAGRAADPSYLDARLTPAQIDALGPLLEELRGALPIGLRIDCALVPLLSGHFRDGAALARFGILGCEAGRYLAAARVDGSLAPCSFAEAAELSVTSAWIAGGGAYRDDATFEAYRALPQVEPCLSCPLRAVCRGGCRIVAGHLEGGPGPDPECPRVRAHRARDAEAPLAP